MVLSLAALFPSGLQAASAGAPANPADGITRELVQRTHLQSAALDLVDLVEYKISYPPGAAAPLHCHPVAGVGYIVAGEARSQFRDGPVRVLHAGDSFMDEAVTPHVVFENTSAKDRLVFVITYAIPPDTPTFLAGDSCTAKR
jgi:quercetin dioxygenase-like cupin family protein